MDLPPTAAPTSTTTKWLREASLRRLNSNLLNKKTILISSNSLNFINFIHLNELESSGLNSHEISYLNDWIDGKITGRQCLLLLLENLMNQSIQLNTQQMKEITTENYEYLMIGSQSNTLYFDILRKSINLPDNFLCNSGFLMETIFSKPPNVVLKEALELLTEHSLETTSSTMTTDQINLALKKIKLQNLSNNATSSHEKTTGGSNSSNSDDPVDSSSSSSNPNKQKLKVRAESYRLSILIELLRNHISRIGNSNESQRVEIEQQLPEPEEGEGEGGEGVTKINIKSENIKYQLISQNINLTSNEILLSTKNLTILELEQQNKLLQPYIAQLLQMKSQLNLQLNNLDESNAFYRLGLTSNSTIHDIKKAYHQQAIKYHPDKPNGNKEKFQELSDIYQECLKKIKLNKNTTTRSSTSSSKDIFEYLLNSSLCQNSYRQEFLNIRKILEKLQNDILPRLINNSNQLILLVQRNLHWKKFLEYYLDKPLLSIEYVEQTLNIIYEACHTHLPVNFLEPESDTTTSTSTTTNANKKKNNKKKKKNSLDSTSTGTGTSSVTITVENSSCEHAIPLLEEITRDVNEFMINGMKIFKSNDSLDDCSDSLYRSELSKELNLMKLIESIAKLGIEVQQNISTSYFLSPERQLTFYLEQVNDYLKTIKEWKDSRQWNTTTSRNNNPHTSTSSSTSTFLSDTYDSSNVDNMMIDIMSSQCIRYIENINTIFQTKYLKLQQLIDHIIQITSNTVEFIIELSNKIYKITEKYVIELQQQEEIQAAAASSGESTGGGVTPDGGMDYCEEDLQELFEKMTEKKRQQNEEKEKNEKALEQAKKEGKEMEYLENQIRGLHLQLRSQYFETIQGLNSEIRLIQNKIVKNIQNNLENELNEQIIIARQKKKKMKDIVDDDSESTSARSTSVDIKDSLFHLLAEFIDTSCLNYRLKVNEIIQIKGNISLEDFREQLISSLGWMGRLGTTQYIKENTTTSDENPPPSPPTHAQSPSSTCNPDTSSTSINDIDLDLEEEIQESTSLHPNQQDIFIKNKDYHHQNNSNIKKKINRLALIPEIKSKILCLSILIDVKSVKDIVHNELYKRLEHDCIQLIQQQQVYDNNSDQNIEIYLSEIKNYCHEIIEGIIGISNELKEY